MADVLGEIVVEIKAKQDKLESDLRKLDGRLKKEGDKLGTTFANGFKNAYGAIAGSVILTQTLGFIKSAIQSYAKAEAAEKRLEIAYGKSTKALVEYAEALQDQTAFADDDIVSAQARIAAFIKEEDAIKRITKASMDFAVAKGVDLNSASELITKSIASGTNALGRYGITIEGAAGSSERLNSVLSELNKKFGGQAQAELETYAGKWKLLENTWDNILEKIGKGSLDVIFAGVKTIFGGGSFAGNLLSQQVNNQLAEVAKQVKKEFESNVPAAIQKTIITVNTLESEIATLQEQLKNISISDIASRNKIQNLINAKQQIIDNFLNPIKKEIETIKNFDLSGITGIFNPDYKGKNVKYRPPTDEVSYSSNRPIVDQYGLEWINKSLEEQKSLWGELQSASSQAMGNLISQWAGAINVIKNANSMLQQFVNTLAQVALQQLESYAIGSFSGGGILGGIASLFSGSSSAGSVAKNAASVTNSKTNIMSWKVDNQSLLLSTQNASKIKESYF